MNKWLTFSLSFLCIQHHPGEKTNYVFLFCKSSWVFTFSLITSQLKFATLEGTTAFYIWLTKGKVSRPPSNKRKWNIDLTEKSPLPSNHDLLSTTSLFTRIPAKTSKTLTASSSSLVVRLLGKDKFHVTSSKGSLSEFSINNEITLLGVSESLNNPGNWSAKQGITHHSFFSKPYNFAIAHYPLHPRIKLMCHRLNSFARTSVSADSHEVRIPIVFAVNHI